MENTSGDGGGEMMSELEQRWQLEYRINRLELALRTLIVYAGGNGVTRERADELLAMLRTENIK